MKTDIKLNDCFALCKQLGWYPRLWANVKAAYHILKQQATQ